LEQYGQYSPAIKNRLAQEISLVSSSATFSVTHRQYTVTTSETPPQFDEQIYVSFIVSLTGKSPNGGIEEVYEKITFTHKNDLLQLDEILSCIQKALDDLLFLYGAKQCPSGEFPCVFGTEAGGVIIHEAIGHGLEADLLQSSVYRGKIGQKIAHADVCIFEDPTMIGYRGSYVMDHEGVLAQKKYLVKNGVLVNYMHSRKTARHFEVEPNGHARRESYAHPTLVRMGITFLTSEHPKAPNKTDLIAAISDGVYISKM
jgi:TldD protein